MILTTCTLCCRLADVQLLVDFVDDTLQKLQTEAENLQVKADNVADQLRASVLGIQQVRETMKEMGVEGGSDIFDRLLDGHSKKKKDLTDTEEALRSSLEVVRSKILGARCRLASLEEHLQELKRGGDGVFIHPHPLPNHSKDVTPDVLENITLHLMHCAACMEGFPFGDVLLCSCRHAYHPWCAAQWFRGTDLCAFSSCGAVEPKWLQSWGFSAHKADGATEVGKVDVTKTTTKPAADATRKKPTALHVLGTSQSKP